MGVGRLINRGTYHSARYRKVLEAHIYLKDLEIPEKEIIFLYIWKLDVYFY